MKVAGRTAAAGVLALLLLVSAACTSGSGGDEDPTASAPGSTEPPAEPSVELPDPTPTVEPATGPRLEVHGVSVRLPRGMRPGYDTVVAATAGGRSGVIILSAIPSEAMSLRAMMRRSVRTAGPFRRVQRLGDRVLGRFSAYHYRGYGRHLHTDVLGSWDRGYRVHLQIALRDEYSPRERNAIVDSVVASYTSE